MKARRRAKWELKAREADFRSNPSTAFFKTQEKVPLKDVRKEKEEVRI